MKDGRSSGDALGFPGYEIQSCEGECDTDGRPEGQKFCCHMLSSCKGYEKAAIALCRDR